MLGRCWRQSHRVRRHRAVERDAGDGQGGDVPLKSGDIRSSGLGPVENQQYRPPGLIHEAFGKQRRSDGPNQRAESGFLFR